MTISCDVGIGNGEVPFLPNTVVTFIIKQLYVKRILLQTEDKWELTVTSKRLNSNTASSEINVS